jgi:secreted PhoX family phosphatase
MCESRGMDRRRFLQAGVFTAGGTAAIPLLTTAAGAQSAGTSPYGSIEGLEPDENGMILPEGFTSRIVAVAGEPVGDTDFEWHIFPDGAATFAQDDGGWIHTVNSEVFVPGAAGVSAIRYDADGYIVDAYEVLRGSVANCGGGPTPWGTFLSGEEWFSTGGFLWECDPTAATEPQAHAPMGIFAHEAAAVDPVREHVYMTEDQPDGRLYRYTPTAYPDLSEGLLEVCVVADDGGVSWLEVPDPSAAETPTRQQVEASTVFLGGEGIWYFEDWIFFTTKFDNKVHGIDLANLTHTVLYEANPDDVADGTAVLSGVDNLTVDEGTGDIFVAEDGGNMEVVIITPEGEVAPFARIVGQDNSEVTGPVFNPSRDRLYFSSQRGPSPRAIGDINSAMDSADAFGGITYEVTGPFRGIVEAPPETTTTTTTAAPDDEDATTTTAAPTTTQAPTTTLAQLDSDSGSDDDSNTGLVIGAGAGAAVVVAAGLIGWRRRAQG